MPKWEYLKVAHNASLTELNRLGDDHWEVVCIIGDRGETLLLKRKKDDPDFLMPVIPEPQPPLPPN